MDQEEKKDERSMKYFLNLRIMLYFTAMTEEVNYI